MKMTRHSHIFLDNSNIFGGAQQVAKIKEHVPWPCVRVDYAELFRLLLHGKRNRKTSMLAGSVPPGNEALWQAARDAGFDTTLLRRVENDEGRLVEQAVDEAIHLRIANLLLDASEPGTIVLATGDGRVTDQGCSFTQQVVRAAKRGWDVEVWSWQKQLSRFLRDAKLQNSDRVKIFNLDHWYGGIVFLKGGTYTTQDGTKTVVGRSTTGLDLTDGHFAAAQLWSGAKGAFGANE